MPERTNPRHSSFDYRTPAAYFVTICTHDRRCLFGRVRRGRMCLNEYGRIAVTERERSEELRDEVVLDAFVVMPISTAGRFTKRSGVNHIHGIVCLVPGDVDDVSPRGYDLCIGSDSTGDNGNPDDHVGPHGDAALHDRSGHPRWEEGRPQRHAKSLGSIIAGFKGTVTTQVNRQRGRPGAAVWQSRNYRSGNKFPKSVFAQN